MRPSLKKKSSERLEKQNLDEIEATKGSEEEGGCKVYGNDVARALLIICNRYQSFPVYISSVQHNMLLLSRANYLQGTTRTSGKASKAPTDTNLAPSNPTKSGHLLQRKFEIEVFSSISNELVGSFNSSKQTFFTFDNTFSN